MNAGVNGTAHLPSTSSAAMRVMQRTPHTDLPRLYDRPARCLVALPAQVRADPRPHYFAFAVSERQLADLALAALRREQARSGGGGTHSLACMDGVELTRHGLRLVRARSGAGSLFLAAGRWRKPPPPPPSVVAGAVAQKRRGAVASSRVNRKAGSPVARPVLVPSSSPPFVGPDGVVPLVAVCSRDPASYARRPTQDQLDCLVKLLGVEPRWWAAYNVESELNGSCAG